ncbi:hypothetical protein M0804_013190 [Polistes exclamans]|nr:hypothetical protein M0804_013190 [Polistes exclamans]
MNDMKQSYETADVQSSGNETVCSRASRENASKLSIWKCKRCCEDIKFLVSSTAKMCMHHRKLNFSHLEEHLPYTRTYIEQQIMHSRPYGIFGRNCTKKQTEHSSSEKSRRTPINTDDDDDDDDAIMLSLMLLIPRKSTNVT